MLEELAELDAVAQAALVRRGEITPRELVAAAIERIERLEPRLNAVVVPLFDEALAWAERAPDGPFRGVPILMKDVGARQAGHPYYAGNRALRDAGYRAPLDTPLGARLREVGFVTVGKSNTPELGLQSTTQPIAFGPARNPWDLERTPGGSSGGSCAAVAAGAVPAAHANDGAGSIRIPAAWCGLVGLKPTQGRIVGPPGVENRSDIEFAVGRSLRDTAALLDALEVPRALRQREGGAFAAELGREVAPLRIGLLRKAPSGATHRAAVTAAERAARCLEGLGHRVEDEAPAALFEQAERALYGALLGPAHYRDCLADLEELLGREVGPEDVEPYLWALAHEELEPGDAEALERAQRWLENWAERLRGWWETGFDLLLTPTVPVPPPRLRELDPLRHAPLVLLERMAPHMAFTEPWNATGQPALTLPVHWTASGLPLGAQLVAARGREDLLLRVAAQLEAEIGWGKRRPPLHA